MFSFFEKKVFSYNGGICTAHLTRMQLRPKYETRGK